MEITQWKWEIVWNVLRNCKLLQSPCWKCIIYVNLCTEMLLSSAQWRHVVTLRCYSERRVLNNSNEEQKTTKTLYLETDQQAEWHCQHHQHPWQEYQDPSTRRGLPVRFILGWKERENIKVSLECLISWVFWVIQRSAQHASFHISCMPLPLR